MTEDQKAAWRAIAGRDQGAIYRSLKETSDRLKLGIRDHVEPRTYRSQPHVEPDQKVQGYAVYLRPSEWEPLVEACRAAGFGRKPNDDLKSGGAAVGEFLAHLARGL